MGKRNTYPWMILCMMSWLVAGMAMANPKSTDPERRFEGLPENKLRAFEKTVMSQVADLSLIPPKLNTSPLPEYDYDQLDYGMTIGIERTPGGRLWACWVAGEDGPKAFFVINRSEDDGETWSKPCLVIDSHDPKHLPMPRSVLVGNLWTDPAGKLHLFFDQSMQAYDGRAGAWETICENPDAEEPIWSEPRRIWHGAVLNKPTVLSTGEWLLPLEFPNFPNAGRIFNQVHKHLEPLRGANVFVSNDQGKTWTRRSAVKFPNPSWPEHMFVELNDGRLWMLARTGKGAMQCFSSDGGYTWTEPSFPTFSHPVARFFIRRLASGRILLVKHGKAIDANPGRAQLTAWLSEDEGQTWKGGLMLDERAGVSYPDGFQAPDGTIYISYDRNRSKDGEILLAKFTEDDVLSGRLVGPKSKLKMLISRPLKNFKAELISKPQAELDAPGGAVHELKKTVPIYSNRSYTFHELPKELTGKRFVFSTLEKTEAVCTKEGVVYVICSIPENNPKDNPVKELTAQGFARTNVPEFVYTLIRGKARKQETCGVYQKIMKSGETVRFGRWGVVVF